MPWHATALAMLVHSAIAGLVVSAVASAVVLLARQPARRAAVICWTWIALVALPLLPLLPGYPHWSILPPIGIVPDKPTHREEPVDVAPAAQRPIANPAPSAARNDMAMPAADAITGPARPITPRRPATARPAVPGRSSISIRDFRPWIVDAYLVGVSLMIAWSLAGLIALQHLLRTARPADAACRRLLREIAGPDGDRVALLVSPRVRQPCAFAWWRITIVLNEDLCSGGEIAEQRLRWALAHEWSHIAGGDLWWWMLGGIVRWFYFYQPLVWWLRRALRLSQDYLADARAAGAGANSEDYAEFLTSTVAGVSPPPLAPGLGIGGRSTDLRRRIVMLVENPRPLETAAPRAWKLALVAVTLAVVAVSASLAEKPAGSAAEPKAATAATAPKLATTPRPAAEPTPTAAKPAATPFWEATRRPIQIWDVLRINVTGTEPGFPISGDFLVEADGTVSLGAKYGRVHAKGANTLRTSMGSSDVERMVAGVLSGATATVELLGPAKWESGSAPPIPYRVRPGDRLAVSVIDPQDNQTDSIVEVSKEGNIPNVLDKDQPPSAVAGKTIHVVEKLLGTVYSGQLVAVVPAGWTAPAAQPVVQPTAPVEEPFPGSTIRTGIEFLTREATRRPALQPLDTVELVLSLKPKIHRELVDGKTAEVFGGSMPRFSGTYLIEPDGDISLPHGYGRVKIAGLDVGQAGAAIRARLMEKLFTRTALPPVRVVRRGRAVFPDGKQPEAPYRISSGDQVQTGEVPGMAFNHEVAQDGTVPVREARVKVAGLSLAEAQEAAQEAWTVGRTLSNNSVENVMIPMFLTLGGWREEADPEVIEKLEGDDGTRMQRLELEVQELKQLIRELKK